MYRLIEGQDILSVNNRWYDGDTSTIYKQDDLLFKVYKKKEPYKRYILDILIANESLKELMLKEFTFLIYIIIIS